MKQPSARSASFKRYRLSQAESLKLALFLGGQRDWAVRHALPLESVVGWHLRRHWLELRRFEQVVPHPVYEMRLRLGRSTPSTKEGIGVVVRQAFAAAGRKVGREFVYVDVRGQWAKVTVYVGGPNGLD